MTKWIKKIGLILLVAFILYLLFARPEVVGNVMSSVIGAFASLGRVFETIARSIP